MILAALFDLDGVVRHFDHDPLLEDRHGLTAGAIAEVAFSKPLIDEVTTGRISRSEWITRIGDLLGAPAAAEEWGRSPFRVDPQVTELAEELRADGIRCAILTNGTDTIPTEIAGSGLSRFFDPVFNSAEIGHAKPDRVAFEYAAEALGIRPQEILFTDDSASKLAGARELGMITHHFTGVEGLRIALLRAGAHLAPARNTAVTRTP